MKNLLFFVFLLLCIVALGLFVVDTEILWLKIQHNYQVSEIYERVELIKSFTQIVAIIIAGVWTYQLYIKNRVDYPFPEINHKVEHYPLNIPGYGRLIYLSVFVTVTNKGKSKLNLRQFKIFVRQILPVPKEISEVIPELIRDKDKSEELRKGLTSELFVDSGQRIKWINLGYRNWKDLPREMRELEPGQTKDYQFDFLIDGNVKVIDIISYIDPDKQWGLSTLHSLKKPTKRRLSQIS